jgi:TolA-binding protein
MRSQLGRGSLLVAPLMAGALLLGCFTREEGDALKREVNELKKQTSDDRSRSEREKEQLRKVMEQATSLLTRNNADVGAQVERLTNKVAELTGQLEERQRKLDELSQKLSEFQARTDVKLEGLAGQSPQNRNPPTPADKDELFKQASAKLAAGDQQEARRLLRHFIDRFPKDPRLDRAQLMLGDSYFAEQKFAPAIVEYKKIVEQYQQSAVVPDALAKIGMAFYQLKFCGDAQLFFSQLLKKYKRHPQAANASRVLGLIRRYRNNREVCRP